MVLPLLSGGRGRWTAFVFCTQNLSDVVGGAPEEIDAHPRPVGLFEGQVHDRPLQQRRELVQTCVGRCTLGRKRGRG